MHGPPKELHTDQGSNFESKLFKAVLELLEIDKTRNTPFHPQSDGQVERFNKTLKHMLTKMLEAHEDDWDDQLSVAMMAYRSSIHETTGETPYMMVHGQEMVLPIDLVVGPPPDE